VTSAAVGIRETLVEERARLSGGASGAAIYAMVARALERRGIEGGIFYDVGCGAGGLWPHVGARFGRYVGVDAVRYEALRAEVEFERADLDRLPTPLPAESADVAASVETIEHLENPRAFVREMSRLTKPGGWVVVTTPNQLSLLSLMTLVCKGRFNQFQEADYPAHLTALLEVDLRRIAAECGLEDVAVEYSGEGRVVFTPRHYPRALASLAPRLFSDNLLLIGRKRARASL